MKKFTNYAPGPRGITVRTKDESGKPNGSETIWLEPGQTESIDPKLIVEPMPDLGEKAEAAAADAEADERIAALEAENEQLKAQVKSLEADLEKATKPAK